MKIDCSKPADVPALLIVVLTAFGAVGAVGIGYLVTLELGWLGVLLWCSGFSHGYFMASMRFRRWLRKNVVTHFEEDMEV